MMENKVDKIKEAVELLKGELEKDHGKEVPSTPIINYLITKCEEDSEFASRITLENKSLKECFEYVLQEVKKILNNVSGKVDNNVVYDMAVNYFNNGNLVATEEISDAITLLENELDKEHIKFIPTEPIINHLISKCKEDQGFKDRITLKNKSLKECFEYVLQEVKKQLSNGNTWIDDPEVYLMADTYYISDEVLIKKPEVKQFTKPSTTAKAITPTASNNINVLKSKVETKNEEQITLFGL